MIILFFLDLFLFMIMRDAIIRVFQISNPTFLVRMGDFLGILGAVSVVYPLTILSHPVETLFGAKHAISMVTFHVSVTINR